MLHLVLGTDWTRNRDALLARIAEAVLEKRPNLVLIVPELITHDTERGFAPRLGIPPAAMRRCCLFHAWRCGWRTALVVR